MVLVMTCLCRATSAAEARVLSDPVWEKSVLVWACPACGDEYRLEMPGGETYLDLEAQSLRLLGERVTAQDVADYARRLKESTPEERPWVRLGRLVRALREKAGLTQEEAAGKAGISARDYKRIEAGEFRRQITNAERATRAVGGSVEQLYLLLVPDRSWNDEFAARLKEALEEFSGVLPVLRPVDDALLPEDLYEDAAMAVRELGEALVANAQPDAFLFLANLIHETYWFKRLGGYASFDELLAKIIPPVKEVIDVLKACQSQREKQAALRAIEREMEAFLTREQLFELGTRFLLDVREETALPEPVATRLGLEPFEPLTKFYTAREGLLLSMFDALAPERQTALLAAFKRLHARARKDGGGGGG